MEQARWESFIDYFHCTQLCQHQESGLELSRQGRMLPTCPGRSSYMGLTPTIMDDCNHADRCKEQLPDPVQQWMENTKATQGATEQTNQAETETENPPNTNAWIPDLSTAAKNAGNMVGALELGTISLGALGRLGIGLPSLAGSSESLQPLRFLKDRAMTPS